MKKIIDQARELFLMKKYDEVLEILNLPIIEEALQHGILNPELLNLKGMCIQMKDSMDNFELEDIANCYQKALEINKNDHDALVELGYYYYVLMNDSEKAESLFKSALEKCRNNLTEIIIGLVKVISEKNSFEQVEIFLSQIKDASFDLKKVQEELEYLKSLEP
jgi:tetratricopeptide (TPR) repeat protein